MTVTRTTSCSRGSLPDGGQPPRRQATSLGPDRSNPAAMDHARSSRIAALALTLAAGAAACTASESEVRPDPDTIFFPTSVAVAPDDSVAFVVSGNSDLTYDSGTVQVVDLAAVEQTVTAWKSSRAVPAGCATVVENPETLACDEAEYLIDDAGVRIGNFATAVGMQELGAGRLRLLVPVRGDPSVTWMDWDPATRKLGCSTASGFALCDDDHRLVQIRDDDSLPSLPAEPYGIYVDSTAGFAVVTHFVNGTVSLIDSPADGTPMVSDAVQVGTLSGLSSVAGRKPGADNLVYVQSRADDRVFVMTVARTALREPFLVGSGFFFQNGVGSGQSTGGVGEDSRGLLFRDDGDRALTVNRTPPALSVIDTSLSPTGVPYNRLVGSTDICRQATSLVAVDTGAGERVYVTCYAEGELYVVDPRGGGRVEATALVGRGPISSAAAASRRLLLVTNFVDASVAVVDLDPTSPFAYRVVMRIGGRS